jgi:CRISPR-associated protein Csc3
VKNFLRLKLETLKETSITNEYYEKIAKDKLQHYKNIVQYGMKEGQTLYSHVINMIGVLDAVKDILDLNENELKTLMVGVTIHDINKLPEYKDKSYLSITSQKNKRGEYVNLLNECKKLSVKEFFKDYKEYIEDIRQIINRHSAHLCSSSEGLFCKDYNLEEDRIELLVEIIRALDIIDLSKSIDEKEKKRQFLGYINSATSRKGKQYKIVTHNINEDRGVLTNICHNAVVQYLKELKYIPIVYYKEGTMYLVEEHCKAFSEEQMGELINKCAESVKGKIYNDFKKYIKRVQSGIVVDSKCLEITTIHKIVYELKIRSDKGKLVDAEKINLKIENHIEESRKSFDKQVTERLKLEIKEIKKNMEETNDKKLTRVLKKSLKEKEEELKDNIVTKFIIENENNYYVKHNEDILRFSEFIRSIYNFIKVHIINNPAKAWEVVYDFFDIDEDLRLYLNIFGGLYIRPFVFGQMIYDKYKDSEEELIEDIIEYLEENIGDKVNKEDKMWLDLKDYLKKNIILSNNKFIERIDRDLLKIYAKKRGNQCCLCSSGYEANSWMAVDVPYKLKVQNFSNKINAGIREPKRNVCSICNIEYLLHKINYTSSVEVSRKYLSLLPRGFNTRAYIKAFREKFQEFSHKDITALYFNEYETFADASTENINSIEPLFKSVKVNGMAVPKYAESLTNYFILPIHLHRDNNDIENWASSLLYALVFNRYFDSKVVISQFPIPILNGDEIKEIYIEEMPIVYKSLFDKEWNQEQCENTIKLFINLFSLARALGEKSDIVYELLKGLARGKMNFIYALYKKLKVEDKKVNLRIRSSSQFTEEILSYITEGKDEMSYIKELAVFANENYIKGGSTSGFLKDNAINKPLNIIADILCRWDKSIYCKEDIIALCKREVEKYFERTDEYFGKKRIDAIDKYVDMFMENIFKNILKEDIYNLENEKKNLLSTYSYYFRAEINKENNKGSEK